MINFISISYLKSRKNDFFLSRKRPNGTTYLNSIFCVFVYQFVFLYLKKSMLLGKMWRHKLWGPTFGHILGMIHWFCDEFERIIRNLRYVRTELGSYFSIPGRCFPLVLGFCFCRHLTPYTSSTWRPSPQWTLTAVVTASSTLSPVQKESSALAHFRLAENSWKWRRLRAQR